MPKFGELFVRRIAAHDAPRPTGPSDLTVFSVAFEHRFGEAATVDVECLYPETGLLSGPRWAVVSVEVDGVEHELARGQIVGHPVALPGEPVALELICRRPDHVDQVDEIYAPFDVQVPPPVIPANRRRRAADFLPVDPYIDPVSLEASLDSVTGDLPPVRDLVGYQGGDGTGDILSFDMQITETPATEVQVEAECYFTERRARVLNLFRPEGGPWDTLTPNALRDSMRQPVLDGPGYQFLYSELETDVVTTFGVLAEAEYTDPETCVVTPALIEDVPLNRITGGRMDFLVTAEQPRRERLRVRIQPVLQDIGGGEVVKESVSLGNVENYLLTNTPYSFRTDSGFVTTKVARTVEKSAAFTGSGGAGVRLVNAELLDVVTALYARAATIATRRAHCVELALELPASAVLGLTLKDRVRVLDSRLTGGVATGKITGISLNFGSSEVAQLTVSCPISDPAFTVPPGAVEGPQVVIEPTYHASLASDPPMTTIMSALSVSPPLVSEIVEEFVFESVAQDQIAEIASGVVGEFNPEPAELPDPLSRVTTTTYRIELVDGDPLAADELGLYSVTLDPGQVYLPEGIVIS